MNWEFLAVDQNPSPAFRPPSSYGCLVFVFFKYFNNLYKVLYLPAAPAPPQINAATSLNPSLFRAGVL